MTEATARHLFINLISDRAPNVAKALRLGRKFLAAGWRVTLYLNLEAVVIANPVAELDPCPISGEPLNAQLAAFLDEGGRGVVGEECLKLAGLTLDDLTPGLTPATFALTAAALGEEGVRIITY